MSSTVVEHGLLLPETERLIWLLDLLQTVSSNVTPVHHYDDDDADIFFDACEVLDNDANENKDPSPQMSSRFTSMSFARCTVQIGKFALIALKYIATHELKCVLQPISSIRKNSVYITSHIH
jgi:hypothetical protein